MHIITMPSCSRLATANFIQVGRPLSFGCSFPEYERTYEFGISPLVSRTRGDASCRLSQFFAVLFIVCSTAFSPMLCAAPGKVFNIRDHGATGRKDQDARPAIQKAIDACAAAG